MLQIRKRNGEDVNFDYSKIVNAIMKANNSVKETEKITNEKAIELAKEIEECYVKRNKRADVEEVQDKVIFSLMRNGFYSLAHNYSIYRYEHALRRKENTIDNKIFSIVKGTNQEAHEENSNKNVNIISTQRDYIAGEVSKDLTRRYLLPKDIMDAHDKGMIHFHDTDYAINKSFNCCLVNLDDMLQNGTVISDTKIDKPHRFLTACNIATQIVSQVASNQYGGQSLSLTHLAKFVDVSRKAIKKEIIESYESIGVNPLTEEQLDLLTEERLKKEIASGIQTIQYQILTLMTTNGQAPFVTLFMYLGEAEHDEQLKHDLAMCIEEVLKQRIQGVKNESGNWITPAFPKLIYVTEEDNIHEDSKYYYLTELAAKCTAKRLVPDYISAKVMKRVKGDIYPCMGCRSFLTPDRFTDNGIGNIANAMNYTPGKHKYYGRENLGVVTVNLPYVAMMSNRDEKLFWEKMDEVCELCHRGLQVRIDNLKGTVADVAPISWMYGAIARLKHGETIDKLLYNGYATISLGYAGVYEAVMYMTGVSHTDENIGKPFAVKIMEFLNNKTKQWKESENIDYSLYGTPIESTTYKFAKALQNDFGIVKEVSDHDYITNSYHRQNVA